MTQFDASSSGSGGVAAPARGSGPNGEWTPNDIDNVMREQGAQEDPALTPRQQAEQDGHDTPESMAADDGDTLALLKSKARTLVEREAELHTVYGFGGEFAIKCTTEISERQIRKWQSQAIPPHKRKAGGSGVGMLDIDQRRIALALFRETAVELHMCVDKDRDVWRRLPTNEQGSIFETQALKDVFGVIDGDSLLNRLFGRKDGLLVRASNEVLGAAGWQDGVTTDLDDDSRFDEFAELDPRKGP